MNRELAIHNIQQLCPPFYRYLKNTYQQPAMLVINDNETNDTLTSEEGSTQGDVVAMAFYALGIRPLNTRLSSVNKSGMQTTALQLVNCMR